jgi:hypothetical protein
MTGQGFNEDALHTSAVSRLLGPLPTGDDGAAAVAAHVRYDEGI